MDRGIERGMKRWRREKEEKMKMKRGSGEREKVEKKRRKRNKTGGRVVPEGSIVSPRSHPLMQRIGRPSGVRSGPSGTVKEPRFFPVFQSNHRISTPALFVPMHGPFRLSILSLQGSQDQEEEEGWRSLAWG